MPRPPTADARKRKLRAVATLRLDAFRIVSDAVERGVEAGWRQAFKHNDSPPSESVAQHAQEQIAMAVMNEIAGVLEAGDG